MKLDVGRGGDPVDGLVRRFDIRYRVADALTSTAPTWSASRSPRAPEGGIDFTPAAPASRPPTDRRTAQAAGAGPGTARSGLAQQPVVPESVNVPSLGWNDQS